MKGFFVKLISLILIVCTLLPTAVACSEDPPPNSENPEEEGGNEGNQSSKEEESVMNNVNAVIKETVTTKIVDFSDAALVSNNDSLKNKFTVKDGKHAFEFDTNFAYTVNLPAKIDVNDCHTVTFDVYNTAPADATVTFYLKNCTAAINVTLDFTGWRHFELKIDAISVANPMPKIDRLEMLKSSGSATPTVLVGGFEAHKYVFDVKAPEGVDLTDESIYDDIIVNFRTYLLGREEDRSLPAYQTKLTTINANCKKSWDSFKASYDKAIKERNFLFNIDMRIGYDGWEYVKWDEDKNFQIYQQITPMALAYASVGSDYYRNEELLADIIKALDYCYDVFYGQCVIDRGTVGNWWGWDIGCPAELIQILTLIEDKLTREQIKHYFTAYDYLVPFPVGSGGNLVNMTVAVIVTGALERDAYRIAQAKYFSQSLFEYITIDKMGVGADGGFYTDGSFIQHNVTPYTGGYGVSLVESLPLTVYITNGTPFAFNDEHIRASFDWVFNSFMPKMYDGNFMGGHVGRSFPDEKYNFNRILKGLILMLPYCPEDLKADFYSFVRTCMHQAGQSFSSAVPLIYSTIAENLYNDESVPLIDDYFITEVFGNECRISHHGPEYGVSIALSSKRIDKYESINGANFTGWYQGDGMIYLYTDGYDHTTNYFNYANPYLVPGTTVNLSERGRGNIYPTIPNKYSFSGGVEHGKYGAAGFILGYDYATTRNTFLEGEKASKIEAQKSYFLFDDEVVCIGSDIYDESGKSVITTVDNRIWRSTDALYINGTLTDPYTHNILTPTTGQTSESDSSYWSNRSHPASALLTEEYREVVPGVRTMYFTNMGGYVFLGGDTVSYSKTTIKGDDTSGTITSWASKSSMDFLEITIEHGKSTNGALDDTNYSYVYLPDATLEETNAYGQNPDVKVLRRSDKCHAVYESDLDIFGAVFFERDSFTVAEDGSPVSAIETNTGCAVMISKNENGEAVVSVSDPAQTDNSISLTLTLNGISGVVSATAGVSATVNGSTVNITVNTKGACGGSFNVTLK